MLVCKIFYFNLYIYSSFTKDAGSFENAILNDMRTIKCMVRITVILKVKQPKLYFWLLIVRVTEMAYILRHGDKAYIF